MPEISLSLSNIIALFGVMFLLAAIPGVSVVLVSTRTMTHGFKHGLYTMFGIITGDILFILLAVLGLALLANIMGNLFIWIKYFGGAYLICLGILMCLTKERNINQVSEDNSSSLSSYMSGLFITLADQKAILFYLGFLPAFMDFNTINFLDILIIILITSVAIITAKSGYAYIAYKSRLLVTKITYNFIHIVAGILMVSIGLFIILRS